MMWKWCAVLTTAMVLVTWATMTQSTPEVLISEVMARGPGTLVDEDGEPSGWIELHNVGKETVDLQGWALTDDPRTPHQWLFPDVSLAPNAYLVVHASRKDRRTPSQPLHSNFHLSSRGGETVVLTSPSGGRAVMTSPPLSWTSYGLPSQTHRWEVIGPMAPVLISTDKNDSQDWTHPDFDDSGWQPSRTRAGLDNMTHQFIDLQDAAPRVRRKPARLRIPFYTAAPNAADQMTLHLHQRRGTQVWLNGTQLDLGSTELLTEFDLSEHLELLRPGDNVLAILGIAEYEVFEHDRERRAQWTYPSDPRLELSSTANSPQTLKPAPLELPTPGRANAAKTAIQTFKPRLSQRSGVHPETVTIAASPPQGGLEIRYTVDGTTPHAQSPLLESPQTLERSILFSARTFRGTTTASPPERAFLSVVDPLPSSDLPVLVLDTFGAEPNGLLYTPAALALIAPGESNPRFVGEVAAQIRGSSSRWFPRRSYMLEIRDSNDRDRATALLGLPAHADWILYPPQKPDKTLLYNVVMYAISRKIERYAPRTRFVEAYIRHSDGPVTKDDYAGLYVLTEKVSRGPHRVDVGDDGFIVKFDRLSPGEVGFMAGGQELQYVFPKESLISDAKAALIRAPFDKLKEALDAKDAERVAEIIDLPAWIDFHILQELSRNPDAHRLSTFLFQKRGGKLTLGPIWDFDRAMKSLRPNARNSHKLTRRWSKMRRYGFWKPLLAMPEVNAAYQARWHELRQGALRDEEVRSLIRGFAAQIVNAQRNSAHHPKHDWEGAVDNMQTQLTKRMAWMDGQLTAGQR